MAPSFVLCRTFFEQTPACRQALSQLKKGVEIGVYLPEGTACALFFDGQNAVLEPRPACRPSVEYHLTTKAIEHFSQWAASEADMGALAVAVFQNIASGTVQIRVRGSLFDVLKDGYLKMLLAAGPECSHHLAGLGFTSAQKIIAQIKRMKSGPKT